jgi:single stranded DNA-binding protein (ssb)
MSAKSVNTCVFTGRLTKDPEMKVTTGGTSIAMFDIAVNNPIKEGAVYKDNTMFLKSKAFGGLADIILKYATKGLAVTVSGRLTEEKWTAPDGAAHSKHIVVTESVVFHGKGAGKAAAEHQPPDEVFDVEPF